MGTRDSIRVRRPLRALQDDYERGDKQALNDLVRAWKGIQELPPSDHRSFFMLAGYHGEPFQYRRDVDALSTTDTYQYWGGYCNHGNVLFPTWHRVYVLKLEQALQTIVPGVSMPYWDETSDETLELGIPWVLTNEQFELDGELIDNPLRSFTLPVALSDRLGSDDEEYEKPVGYETVRYPLSGLVGTPEARAATAEHNAQYPHEAERRTQLNDNVMAWATTGPTTDSPENTAGSYAHRSGVRDRYLTCLDAPNYTVFSNTTSAAQWNVDHPDGPVVVALESPHNDIHLAVGGFDAPGGSQSGERAGANGDMGENNTAAMDPIFFFHHCFVDRVFWLWQQRHGQTSELGITSGYAGADNASDGQGPTPGLPPGAALATDTALNPFVHDDFGNPFTSTDCVDIEALGYMYEDGSLVELADRASATATPDEMPSTGRTVVVSGIDRALFQGSFVISAYAVVPDSDHPGRSAEYYLGHHAVLSRRNIVRCANCLTHLEVRATFPLDMLKPEQIQAATFRVEVQHRGHVLPDEFDFDVEVRGGS